MGAIVLEHEAFTNCNFTVIHHRRYTQPWLCPMCDQIHEFKTYHLRLDSQGRCEVSKEVYERLAELEGLPLRKVGTEAHPRPQRIAVTPGGVQAEGLGQAVHLFIPPKLREAVEASDG